MNFFNSSPVQPHPDNGFPRHRLGRDIVLYILLFSSLITLIGTSWQLWLDFSHERSMVEQRLQEIEISHLPNLNQDVWLTRYDTVALQLRGIAELPHIRHIKIILTNGDEIFQGEKGGNHLMVRTFPLQWLFNDQLIPLGTLEVTATLDHIYAHLQDQLLIILATQAIKTFLVSFFILFLLHFTVGRRLRLMAEYAHQIQLKHLETLQPLPHRPVTNGALNELDHLSMALNHMVSELRVAYLQSQVFTQAIQRERDRANQYLNLVGGIIVEINHEEKITLINQAGCELLGYAHTDEVVGLNWFDNFLPEEIRENLRIAFKQSFLGDVHSFPIFENPVLCRDGSERHILWNNVLLDDDQGRINHSLSHGIDVTQRKKAEQELLANQTLLNAIINNTQAVIFIKDLAGRFLLINQQFEKLFGITNQEIIGRCDDDIFPKDVADRVRANDQLALEQNRVEREERVPMPDGSWSDYLSLKFCLFNPDGMTYAVCGIATEITDLKRVQDNLQRESNINLALQRISQMLITPDFQISDVARLLLELAQKLTDSEYGYVAEIDPITGYTILSSLRDHLPSCHNDHNQLFFAPHVEGNFPGLRGYALNLGRGFFTNDPATHPAFTGKFPPDHILVQRFLSVPIMLNSRPVGQIVLLNPVQNYTTQDLDAITRLGAIFAIALHQKRANAEKQQIELRLNHAQKLEAIGALSAGIAHDFNNILAVIMGNAEFGQLTNKDSPKMEELFKDILQAALRGRDLVKQLLNFSRRTQADFIAFQPQAVLNETLRLLRSTISATVEIVSNINPTTGILYGDPVQFQQVLMNLCSNAVHALSDRPNPCIAINFEQVTIDHTLAVRLNVIKGDYCCLMVKDNGCGIINSIRERIFDPFFTTKSVGVGTGLGLAMVHSYIQEIQGAIDVQDVEKGGTQFKIYLPISFNSVNSTENLHQNHLALNNRGRIMLIDDEPHIVKVVGRMLELLGFSVAGYHDPRLALEHFAQNPANFVALLTDRAMPEINGEELGQQVHALNHTIPIFLCSGFIDHALINTDTHPWLSGILKKPITLIELDKAITPKLTNQTLAISTAQNFDKGVEPN